MSTPSTPAATPELRYAVLPITGLELRGQDQTGDGSFTLTGYAAVTEQETTLYDGRFWRLREVIARGAFGPVLSRMDTDVHLNVGHDMTRAIARTGVDGVGRLELTEDDTGLRMWARLDPSDPDVAALIPKMRNGIIDQASFAFTVSRDETTLTESEDGKEDELRRILEVGELYDVTVVARGAYPQTSAAIRALFGALGRSGPDPEGRPIDVAPQAGVVPIAPPAGGFIAAKREAELMRMRAVLAKIRRK